MKSTLIAYEEYGFKHPERKHYIWAASWQNQQNNMCAQSDRILRCPHEESLGP